MGNSSCCPTSTPCDHTVDETQGLLNSPDSKVTARPLTTDGVSQALEVEESSKNEADCIRKEKDVVNTQPVAASKSAEGPGQSSYGSVIQILHTEVSLATQTSQSASSSASGVSEEPADTANTATETKKDDNATKESQISATDLLAVKAPIELATAKVESETEAQINDTVPKEGKADGPNLMVQVGTAEGLAEDVQEDTEEKVAEEHLEKRQAEADHNEDSPEMTGTEGAGEVDAEKEELKTPEALLPMMDALQKDEPVLNNSTVDEVKGFLIAENIKDNLLPNNSSAEPLEALSESLCEVEKPAIAVEKPVADKVLENHEVCVVSSMLEMKEDSLPSKSQEPSEQEFSPAANISEETTVNCRENDQVGGLTDGDLKNENSADMDVEVSQLNEVLQKPCEEPSSIENEELMCESSASSKSAIIAEEVETTDTADVQKTITEFMKKEGDLREVFQNGLHTFTPVEKHIEQMNETEPESNATGPIEALHHDITEEMELAPQASENDKTIEEDEKKNAEGSQAPKGEIIYSSSHDMKVELIPVSDLEILAEKDEEHEDSEDLYRGDDEIEQEQAKEIKSIPLLEITLPGVEEKCSLAAAVDVLAYSEREWKGNTAKSNLIRKGYSEISCSFTGLRRVRGDNYCSLRATLYQVLATTTHMPAWLLEEDFTSLPEKIEAEEHLIGMWVFPPQCVKVGEKEDAVEKLKHYLELLQKRWQEAADAESLEDKQGVCDQVFQGGEEEYALLEVLKFLMLDKAMELHRKMQAEQEVPVFCWLLFARDTSENPKMFFRNHLSQVGFSGGLEQVEMFLLGYALQHTIQAFRLYKTDTEEFVTHYPDDHKHDWPCLCIVTEDDRHYNVPVRKPARYRAYSGSDLT